MDTSPFKSILPECIITCAVDLPSKPEVAEALFGAALPLPSSVRNAVANRRGHYLAGRYCAREAMRQLKGVDAEVGRDDAGRPLWPAGLIGSITHTDGLAAAAVGERRHVEAVGIDAEQVMDTAVAQEVGDYVVSTGERSLLASSGLGALPSLTLAFSAKEALFKCLNPIVRRFFEYRDAELIRIDAGAGRLAIRLRTDLGLRFRAGDVFEGRFAITGRHVRTGIALLR